MLRKLVEKQRGYIEEIMDQQMIPLIRISIQESIRQIEEEETKSEGPKDPLQILKIQFAKGEISEEEYLRKKKILEE
ncbi:MAG: SHOCT domain-containing protein [Candidatus Lokiarchaeota archaeon]|nr:SHOCT domain-containing protein [Candidatus Lokiarchaeota archaeon]